MGSLGQLVAKRPAGPTSDRETSWPESSRAYEHVQLATAGRVCPTDQRGILPIRPNWLCRQAGDSRPLWLRGLARRPGCQTASGPYWCSGTYWSAGTDSLTAGPVGLSSSLDPFDHSGQAESGKLDKMTTVSTSSQSLSILTFCHVCYFLPPANLMTTPDGVVAKAIWSR